jgi:hypothetical protein
VGFGELGIGEVQPGRFANAMVAFQFSDFDEYLAKSFA